MVLESHDGEHRRGPGTQSEDELPRRLTDSEKRRQRIRSLAIAWFLVALAILFFLVTIVRLGSNVANRPI